MRLLIERSDPKKASTKLPTDKEKAAEAAF